MAANKKKTGRATSTRSRKTTAGKKKKTGTAMSLSSAGAGFTVDDIEKSLAWYRDVLGFAVKERWEEKGELQGVEMVAGRVSFMLGQDDWKKGRNRVKGQGVRIFCTTTQDIDRLADRVRANGGRLSEVPTSEMGMRAFSVDDPDGYKITIWASSKRR